MANVTTFLSTDYSLIDTTADYSEASITTNPNIRWAKFVFADDQPNKNNQRITQAEFGNIIKTGANMPIKMEPGNPNGSHDLSSPVGVITNLAKQDNKVVGLAALWKKEFPDDVEMLEKAFEDGNPLNLSWELFFEKADVDENGIETLEGTTVRAITFVGNPAYGGRTQVIAMAEETKKQEEHTLADTNVADLEAKVAELTTALETAKSELTGKVQELSALLPEVETLRQYKAQREAQDAKSELISTRRKALVEAGVSLTDEEFTARSERIASMDDDTFSFYVQDLVAFSARKPASAGTSTPTIPDLTTTDPIDPVAVLLNRVKK